jgi:hypothetical protein
MTHETDEVVAPEHGVFAEPPELAGMDARILAAYRREFGSGRSLWRRSLQVPLPVAALVLMGLFVCAVLAFRGRPAENATVPSADSVQTVRHDRPVVTNTSLAGFEPIDDIQLIVVGKGP